MEFLNWFSAQDEMVQFLLICASVSIFAIVSGLIKSIFRSISDLTTKEVHHHTTNNYHTEDTDDE